MKENIIKASLATVAAGISIYFQMLLLPVIMLIFVMALDYATGMIKAWITKELHSRYGIVGIVKKVCYLLVVCCGTLADWVLHETLSKTGISYNVAFAFGLMVSIWLIINEMISILENLGAIGVPMPGFLMKIIKRLKVTVENSADDVGVDKILQDEQQQ